ncbi:aminopyrimidine aminohydrolase [Lentibacillus kapialis]|uniref:Aminopyrimidine aminohydrolase n=1 Tax=Lentibacillus kapialis TaxID=340214 RepID=A0A917PRH3_9BACI|nr:thiaminase II [Lentibacillus kapialis]GGJ88907.1 aminopyrimidine aminohydrolase [Lentibacillus kapialis]
MTFTQMLRKENDDIFRTIFNHPFVDGIGKGEVPDEAIAHYIKADYEYLSAFIRIYGTAISKSAKREDMRFFNDQIQFVLNSEIHPHHNFCDHIGVGYVELQDYPLPPTADHYMKHMMYHAHMGGLGETIGALLPCPWTYLEIGQELKTKYAPSADHPFYQWISFYADESTRDITRNMRQRLDKIAEDASHEEQKHIKEAFRKSCQLELAFWEMAYTCEEWPGEKVSSQ